MKKIILVLSILAVLFTVSCKDKGTDPGQDKIDSKYNGTYEFYNPNSPGIIGVPSKIKLTDGKITIYNVDESENNDYNDMTVTKENDTTYKFVVKLPDTEYTKDMKSTAILVFSGDSGSYSFIMDMVVEYKKVSDGTPVSYEAGPYTYNQVS